MSHWSHPPSRRTRRRRRRRAVGALAAAAIVITACGSDDGDEVETPADSGTVVPPDPNGVGGGVPVDNLDPDVADTTFQNADDTNGDGDLEP